MQVGKVPQTLIFHPNLSDLILICEQKQTTELQREGAGASNRSRFARGKLISTSTVTIYARENVRYVKN